METETRNEEIRRTFADFLDRNPDVAHDEIALNLVQQLAGADLARYADTDSYTQLRAFESALPRAASIARQSVQQARAKVEGELAVQRKEIDAARAWADDHAVEIDAESQNFMSRSLNEHGVKMSEAEAHARATRLVQQREGPQGYVHEDLDDVMAEHEEAQRQMKLAAQIHLPPQARDPNLPAAPQLIREEK